MTEDTRVPYRIRFARLWEARFISHLDLMRAFMRLLRRTGLPIYFSEGFNPKPKISYRTMPLSSGHTSECERVFFQLMEELPETEVERAFAAAMPPGLVLDSIRRVRSAKKDENPPKAMQYYIYFTDAADGIGERLLRAARDENVQMEVLDMETAAVAILLEKGDSSEFIKNTFPFAVSAATPVGNDYVRPDRIVEKVVDPEKIIIHYHRRKEIIRQSQKR